MTSVSGTMYGSKTLVYNDDNRLTSLTYGGVTDLYYYTYNGLRYRARLAGTYYRYLYNGERVLEELNDTGTMQARYTTENDTYYGQWLHLYRPSGSLSRFPMYDNIGSARGLLDASGTATDWYELDTFGRQVSNSGTTPNPYRFGAAWGYITDPSGFLQLGARFYWPEVGRFVSQDPDGEDANWYAYVDNNALSDVDPEGLKKTSSKAAPKESPECKKCDDDYLNGWVDCGKKCRSIWSIIGGAIVGALPGPVGRILGWGNAGSVIQNQMDVGKCLQENEAKYKKCCKDHHCKVHTLPELVPGSGGKKGKKK
jgi:RHS repeat-associated protein